MKERNIRGNPTKGEYNGLLIPSKSGYIINAYVEKMSVSANMAYPASIYNGKQITSEQSLSKIRILLSWRRKQIRQYSSPRYLPAVTQRP